MQYFAHEVPVTCNFLPNLQILTLVQWPDYVNPTHALFHSLNISSSQYIVPPPSKTLYVHITKLPVFIFNLNS